MKSLTHVFEKYGNSVCVNTDDQSVNLKCFINRLRRRSSMNLPKDCDRFKDSNNYFLYIGPSTLKLIRGDRVISSNSIYTVECSDKFETDEISYIWAIMSEHSS